MLNGIEIGLLRSSGDYPIGEVNNVARKSFSGSLAKISIKQKQLRNLQNGVFVEMTIPSVELGTDASINVTDTEAFEEYDTVALTSLLYRDLAHDFGTDYHPVVV